MSSPTMTIGQLSEITGLSVSAIRFYQRRGLLPARDGGAGWQRFGHETLDRLAVIELAKSAGFSLDEIVRLFDALNVDPDSIPTETPIWQGLAEAKILDIDAHITRLQQMRQLLTDILDCSYLPADRARQVPGALCWTVDQTETATEALRTAQIPNSTKDLDTSLARKE